MVSGQQLVTYQRSSPSTALPTNHLWSCPKLIRLNVNFAVEEASFNNTTSETTMIPIFRVILLEAKAPVALGCPLISTHRNLASPPNMCDFILSLQSKKKQNNVVCWDDVCLSVRLYMTCCQRSNHLFDFREILYGIFFTKGCRECPSFVKTGS